MTTRYPQKFHRSLVAGPLLTALCISSSLLVIETAVAGISFNPPGGGAPQGTRGGASRGDVICTQNPTAPSRQQFMLLTPADSNYGLTLAGHPRLFAYIPPTTARQAFFSLKNEDGGVVYQTRFAIAGNGGVVQLNLPESIPALVVGKNYQWGIAVLCSGKLRPDSPNISAWVKRVEPVGKLGEQLPSSPSLEQVKLYGTNGIWYDTLATLADLKLSQSSDTSLTQTWNDLLGAVGLGEVASQPLVERVSLTD